ncbi:zinc-binding dehydrogenase [Streptomyces antibioticus]|uniref:zinc-binding dehydrogenase n=1 Tax=Streptomyces antibioticus TaxID=1890 RepID=UPI0036A0B4E1
MTGLTLGEEVTAYLPDGGAYAEYAAAPASFVFPLTDVGLDPRTAGAAPLALTTAYGVPAGAARIAAGDTVLVHAAAQPARSLGATAVYGTVSTREKAEYTRRSGYDEAFERDASWTRVRAATSGRGVDIVLDPIGGPTRRGATAVTPGPGRPGPSRSRRAVRAGRPTRGTRRPSTCGVP